MEKYKIQAFEGDKKNMFQKKEKKKKKRNETKLKMGKIRRKK